MLQAIEGFDGHWGDIVDVHFILYIKSYNNGKHTETDTPWQPRLVSDMEQRETRTPMPKITLTSQRPNWQVAAVTSRTELWTSGLAENITG
jgi:hypothetical protein